MVYRAIEGLTAYRFLVRIAIVPGPVSLIPPSTCCRDVFNYR